MDCIELMYAWWDIITITCSGTQIYPRVFCSDFSVVYGFWSQSWFLMLWSMNGVIIISTILGCIIQALSSRVNVVFIIPFVGHVEDCSWDKDLYLWFYKIEIWPLWPSSAEEDIYDNIQNNIIHKDLCHAKRHAFGNMKSCIWKLKRTSSVIWRVSFQSIYVID